MAHLAARTGYPALVERLNRSPQGAPPSDLLYAILKMLMSEKEASLVALVPLKPFTAKTAARAWRTSLPEARKSLDALARGPSSSTSQAARTRIMSCRRPWPASSSSP